MVGLVVDNSIEHLSLLREKIKDASKLMKEKPAYGSAANLQRTKREYELAVKAYRAKNIKLVWNFEDKLMEDIERLVA